MIDKFLFLRVFGITTAQVEQAVATIQAICAAVSKSAVRRALGVSEAKAISDLLSQRRHATVTELVVLCGKFEQRLATVPTSRDQRPTLVRDYILFLVSVLSGHQIEQVCEMGEAEVRSFLSEQMDVTGISDAPRHLVSVRATQLNDMYASAEREELSKSSSAIGPWFVSRSGADSAGHSVRDRVTKMMKSGFPATCGPVLMRSCTFLCPTVQPSEIRRTKHSYARSYSRFNAAVLQTSGSESSAVYRLPAVFRSTGVFKSRRRDALERGGYGHSPIVHKPQTREGWRRSIVAEGLVESDRADWQLSEHAGCGFHASDVNWSIRFVPHEAGAG